MGELFAGPGFRTCSRSGCRWPAVATMGFDYAMKRAWLDELQPREDPATYDLCSLHSERFSSPEGWTVEDRRFLPEPLFHLDDPPPVEELRRLASSEEQDHQTPRQAGLPEL